MVPGFAVFVVAIDREGKRADQAAVGSSALSASMHIRHFGKLTIMCVRHTGTWNIKTSPASSGLSIPAPAACSKT